MAMLSLPESYDNDNADWDEDQVDLSFRTVSDLQSLLPAGNIYLDFQLFKQSSQIHKQMRKKLNSVPTKPSDSLDLLSKFPYHLDKLPSSSVIFESSTSSEVSSQTYIFENSSIFSSSSSSNVSSTSIKDAEASLLGSIRTIASSSDLNIVFNYEDFHIHIIICILLGLLLLFFLLFLLIIFRCKSSWQKRHQVKEFQIQPSYVKTSYSLEDIPTRPCHSQACVVDIGEEVRPSYNPVSASPCSPVASFSTFHPPVQDRSSPEGSSCGGVEEESNDRDEGIECEEDIYLPELNQMMVMAKEEEESSDRVEKDEGCDREAIYAKINYDAKLQGCKRNRCSFQDNSNTNKFCKDQIISNKSEFLI